MCHGYFYACSKSTNNLYHCWRRALCRVTGALGKGPIALGKGFAECHTRQRANGKAASGEGFFAECRLSSTQQRLCRVPGRHLAKKIGRQPLTVSLSSAGSGRHSAKLFPFFLKNPLPSAFLTRHSAKNLFF